MNKRELLMRYGNLEDPTKKKKKKSKHRQKIIDEDAGWTLEEEEEAPVVVEQGDFQEKFKKDGWSVIEPEYAGARVERISVSPERGRSPSVSPVRRSPSPSPSPTRNSPSPSPERHSTSRGRSPSPSPERHSSSRRKSPTPSPDRLSRNDRSPKRQRRDRSPSPSPEPHEIPDHQKQTVHRTKTGKKIDIEAQIAEQRAARLKKAKEEARKAEWGGGLVQRQEEIDEAQRLLDERNRNFAIYSDDEDINNQLKEKERWGDTMAGLISKKESVRGGRKRYKGPAPQPNRFGIEPGYHWDGIDRSNGWEKKVFQARHERKTLEGEYHRWATEDM